MFLFSRNSATLYSLLEPEQAQQKIENDLAASLWLGGTVSHDGFKLRASAPAPSNELLVGHVEGMISPLTGGGSVIKLTGKLRRAQKVYLWMWLIVFIILTVLINTGGMLDMETPSTVSNHKILPGMVVPPMFFFFFVSYCSWIYFSSIERVKRFLCASLEATEANPNSQ